MGGDSLPPTANPNPQKFGILRFMTIYFSRDDLRQRIEQINDHVEMLGDVFLAEREELIYLFNQLEGKEDCFIDRKGNIMGKKPNKTSYSLMKAKKENREEFEKKRRAFLYKALGVENKRFPRA